MGILDLFAWEVKMSFFTKIIFRPNFSCFYGFDINFSPGKLQKWKNMNETLPEKLIPQGFRIGL